MNEQILTSRPAFPAQIDFSHPLSRSLVGCWVLNDNGSRAWDSSPYKNHGVSTGVKRTYFSGIFDGISSKITVPASPSLQMGSGDFAWVFNVKPTSLVSSAYLFGSSKKGVSIYGTSGAIQIELEGAATFQTNVSLIVAGIINFIAIVRRGADALIYKNGGLFQTVANGFASGNNTTSENLIIGYNS